MLRPNHDPQPLMSNGCLGDDKLRILGRGTGDEFTRPLSVQEGHPRIGTPFLMTQGLQENVKIQPISGRRGTAELDLKFCHRIRIRAPL